MTRPILVQLGLFGGSSELPDMHVVEAHTRILADGSEVFVGEHLRWNRGRHASTPRVARPRPAVPEDHPRLFDWDEPALPDPLPTPTRKGTATQLSLW